MPIRTSYGQVKLDTDKKRYYKSLKYPKIPLSIDDIYVITTSGDRLQINFIMMWIYGGLLLQLILML